MRVSLVLLFIGLFCVAGCESDSDNSPETASVSVYQTLTATDTYILAVKIGSVQWDNVYYGVATEYKTINAGMVQPFGYSTKLGSWVALSDPIGPLPGGKQYIMSITQYYVKFTETQPANSPEIIEVPIKNLIR